MDKNHESNMGDGPIPIKIAYDELSQEAFAIWIRMMVATDSELIGRGKVAQLLGYSEGRSNEILRELKNKGYIKLEKGAHPGLPTGIIVSRRPIISGYNRFVKLSLHSESQTTHFPTQNLGQS